MANATPPTGYMDRSVEALRRLGYRPESLERLPYGHYYSDHVDPWVATCPACYVAFGDTTPVLTVSALLGFVCWGAVELGGQHPPGLIESILGLDPIATPRPESPTTPRPSSVHGLPWGLPRGL